MLIIGIVRSDDFGSIHPANVFRLLHSGCRHRLRQVENVGSRFVENRVGLGRLELLGSCFFLLGNRLRR